MNMEIFANLKGLISPVYHDFLQYFPINWCRETKHDVVFGVELSPKSRYDNQEAHCGYTTVPRHQQWSLATYTGGKELPSRKLKIARRFFNFLCKGNDQVPKLEVITDDIRGLCNPSYVIGTGIDHGWRGRQIEIDFQVRNAGLLVAEYHSLEPCFLSKKISCPTK